ncbi:MAG: PadR family transcriptional regulator [Candidatus Binatia bacterium]|nr:PadR family transcriptional regulator [Candidatus Binatia bacterium]
MLQHAILTLLQDGADHGYRLKQRLDGLLGPVWCVNVGQVYQVLDRLRRQRWVEELPPETNQRGGHERWPVAITAEGEAELARWRSAEVRPTRPPGPARNQILGRLAVGGRACLEEILEGVLVERAVYARELDLVADLTREFEDADTTVESAKFLALEASRLSIRAHIEWLELCAAHLNADAYDAQARTGRPRRRASLERSGPGG